MGFCALTRWGRIPAPTCPEFIEGAKSRGLVFRQRRIKVRACCSRRRRTYRRSRVKRDGAAKAHIEDGEMQEWFNWQTWKVCARETVPWVRIPLSPPVGKCLCWLARCAGSPADFKRKLKFFVFIPRSGTPEASFVEK